MPILISLVFTVYALFASLFTIEKIALLYSPPIFLVGSRMLLAGAGLTLFCLYFRKESFRLNRKGWSVLIWLSLFNIFLTNCLEVWGIQYLSSAKTCFIYSLSPFISAIFSYYLFNQNLTIYKLLGMCVSFLGFLPVFLSESPGEDVSGGLGPFSWAEIAVTGAAVCSVYGWILMKKMVTEFSCSPLLANGISMFVGGGFSLFISFVFEGGWEPFPVAEVSPFFLWMGVMTLISNILCYNLYGYLLKTFSATFMAFAGLTTPLFASLIGFLILGEQVGTDFFFSLSLVSFGLFIFYKEELNQGYVGV